MADGAERVDGAAGGRRRSHSAVVFGLAIAVGLLAACSSDAHPAKSDVTITGCRTDTAKRKAVVTGSVHNRSSKRSDYVVQTTVTANGSKIETGGATVTRVAPGARKTFVVRPVGVDVPTGTTLTCTVAHVRRIAD